MRGGRGTPRLWGLLAALVALWGLTGFARAASDGRRAPVRLRGGRARGPAAAELLRGRRLADARPAAVAAAVVLPGRPTRAGARCTPGGHLRARRATPARAWPPSTWRGPGVPDQFRPIPAQPQVIAGPVLKAQRDFGRIALTPAQLRRAPAADREAADQTLLGLGELSVQARAGQCSALPAPALQARRARASRSPPTPHRGARVALRAARVGGAADDGARRLDHHHR